MKELVPTWHQTSQHWKQEAKGVINIFRTWKEGENFEPQILWSALTWRECPELGMFTSLVCLEMGERKHEKFKPESVLQQKLWGRAKSCSPDTLFLGWYMWSQFLVTTVPAVRPARFVMVAANPILNLLPVVPPITDFTTSSSFLVIGGAMASHVLLTNEREARKHF